MYSLFIKHKAFMDVCIEIDHFMEDGKIVGRFWNMGQTKPYPLGSRITLELKDKADWQVSLSPARNGNWEQYNGKNI